MRTIELDFGYSNNYFMREAFNTLRTNILFSGKDVKTIIFTSCVAHEGKTTVSFETAKSLSEANKKVLVIDADLRKSVTATRYIKERGICGLSQILSGQVDLSQALYHTQYPGLDVIFAGPFPPNPTELVGSSAFKELLDSVRPLYDYVIVDVPPLGLVIDAAIMANVCDGAVIVINQGTVKHRMAQDVKAQLQKTNCRILGVVLNQTQRKNRGLKAKDSYYSQYGEYYSSAATEAPAPKPTPKPQQPTQATQTVTPPRRPTAQQPAARPTQPQPPTKKL